ERVARAAIAGLGEGEHAGAERAGDAERAHALLNVELERPRRGQRGAEHAGDPGRVEAHLFARALGGESDAEHAFAGGDEGGEQVTAHRALLLGASERADDRDRTAL